MIVSTLQAFGQGQIQFDNRTSIIGHPAGVNSIYTGLGLAGADGWVANLYLASDPTTPIVLEGPAPFRNTAMTLGTFAGGTRNFIPQIANGQTLSLIVRVWNSHFGNADTAQTSGFGGNSPAFSYTVPAVGAPPSQLSMVNLYPFNVGMIPEPSVIALGILGLAASVLKRRK